MLSAKKLSLIHLQGHWYFVLEQTLKLADQLQLYPLTPFFQMRKLGPKIVNDLYKVML